MTEDESRQKMTDFIKDAQVALLTTVDTEGSLVSRPMAMQSVEFDGDLWFFTSKSSPKVDELEQNPEVNVAFQAKNAWVSVSGTAQTVDDHQKAEELWNPFVKAYFPGGLEDPDLCLLKVHAHSAEYWDGENKLVGLFKMAKAAATDTVPDMGENKTIDLDN